MNNAGLPPGLPKESDMLSDFAEPSIDPPDIPEAVREVPRLSSSSSRRIVKPASRTKRKLLWGISISFIALMGLGLGLGLLPHLLRPVPAPVIPLATATPQIVGQANVLLNGDQPAPLLNHLPYIEAPRTDLKSLTSDGKVLLRRSAAAKFSAMAAAAKANGVLLVPLSGFRSIADQERVFFDLKAQRGQNPEKRAAVSAPPGYSEHHTGYAIDIGDGNRPATHLQENFDTTAAYRWLKQNAAFYSFELSFPKNNSMGVSYEPWHWRFVGDRNSLETFYRARQPQP